MKKMAGKAKKEEAKVILDEVCALMSTSYKGIGAHCLEYRFHPVRKWRFDYAFPDIKLAIELDGGVWISGRHNRGVGYIKDMEKLNEAAILGWHVLRFIPDDAHSLRAALKLHHYFAPRFEFMQEVSNITDAAKGNGAIMDDKNPPW